MVLQKGETRYKIIQVKSDGVKVWYPSGKAYTTKTQE